MLFLAGREILAKQAQIVNSLHADSPKLVFDLVFY